MPDPEDVKEALVQMDVLESQGAQNVRYLINNFPSSTMERQYVGRYLSQIPLEKTMGWVGSVKAIRTLRENDEPTFQTPPSRVNNLSRSLYRQVRDAFNHQHLRADKTLEIAVGGIQRLPRLDELVEGRATHAPVERCAHAQRLVPIG